jgi:microcystin degradation protein MlrC
MRIFTATLMTETNSFSPLPTGLMDFEANGLFFGDGSTRGSSGVGAYARHVRDLAEAGGHQLVESVSAFAVPGGPVNQSVYEMLRDRILADVVDAMPLDAVHLTLHGAMIADGCDDCEGDILARVRAIVGDDVIVGAELDLHCHMTRAMVTNADLLIAFKHYPHVDWRERASELFDLLVRAAKGEIRPVTALFDCKMLGFFHTTREPMAGFVTAMQAAEAEPAVLSVSLGHGFPAGDVAEGGAALWVIADGDPARAKATAQQLGKDFVAIREEVAMPTVTIDQAFAALAEPANRIGPVVLADIADNPGGGAAGDSTFLLKRVLEDGIVNVAVGVLWDPVAVDLCHAAGAGAMVRLRIGGKCGPASGDPVDLEARVTALTEEHSQKTYDGRLPLGRAAAIETAGGIAIALASVRNQVMGLDALTGLAIDPASKAVVVVKSAHHFHTAFAAIASRILYVTTPGAVPSDMATIPFKKMPADYWPRVSDPRPAIDEARQRPKRAAAQ